MLVDGRIVGSRKGVVSGRGGTPVRVGAKPAGLTAGTHALRVVAYRTGWVRQQAFAEREIEVAADGKVSLKP